MEKNVFLAPSVHTPSKRRLTRLLATLALCFGLALSLAPRAEAAEGCKKFASDLQIAGGVIPAKSAGFINFCGAQAHAFWGEQCYVMCEQTYPKGEALNGCNLSCAANVETMIEN